MGETIQLKGGFETNDPRLDRLVEFDERSRSFPIRGALTPQQTAEPRSYTWSCKQYLDQRKQGACVAFAWEHELAARPVVVTYGTVETHEKLARERYWEMQRTDQWPGGSYPGADPVYEGTSVLAGAKVHTQLGTIREYRWAFGIDDLALAIGYKGPAVLGVNWYTGMFDTDADGFIHVTGQVEGGHSILCNAFNAKRRIFRVHNSWNQSWGVGGDAYLSWDDMEKLLKNDGEACIPVVRVRKNPPLVGMQAKATLDDDS